MKDLINKLWAEEETSILRKSNHANALKTTVAKQLASTRDEVKTLLRSSEQLASMLDKDSQNYETLDVELKVKEESIQELRKQILLKGQKIVSLQALKNEQSNRLKKLDNEILIFEQEIDCQENQLITVKKQIRDLHPQEKKLRKKHKYLLEELNRKKDNFLELHNSSKNLENFVRDLEIEQQQLDLKVQQISVQNCDYRDLKNFLTNRRKRLLAKQDHAKKELKVFNHKLLQLKREIKDLVVLLKSDGAELGKYTESLQKLKKEYSERNVEKEFLEKEILTLQTNANSFDKEYQNLGMILNTTRSQIEKLVQDKEQLKVVSFAKLSELKKIRTDLDHLLVKKSSEEDCVHDISVRRKILNDRVVVVNNEKCDLEDKLNLLVQKRLLAEHDLVVLQNELNETEKVNKGLTFKIQRENDSFAEVDVLRRDFIEKIAKTNKQIFDYNIEIESKKDKIILFKEEVEKLNMELASKDSIKEKSQEKIKELDVAAERLKINIEKLTPQVLSLRESFKEILDVEKKQNDDKAKLEHQLLLLKDEQGILQKDLEAKNKIKTDVLQDISYLHAQIELIEKDNQNLEQQLLKLDIEISDASFEKTNLQKKKNLLENNCLELRNHSIKKIADFKEMRENLLKELTVLQELEEQESINKRRASEVGNKLQMCQHQLQEVLSARESSVNSIMNYEMLYQTNETRLKTLTDEFVVKERELSKLKKNVKEIESLVVGQNSIISKLGLQIKELEHSQEVLRNSELKLEQEKIKNKDMINSLRNSLVAKERSKQRIVELTESQKLSKYITLELKELNYELDIKVNNLGIDKELEKLSKYFNLYNFINQVVVAEFLAHNLLNSKVSIEIGIGEDRGMLYDATRINFVKVMNSKFEYDLAPIMSDIEKNFNNYGLKVELIKNMKDGIIFEMTIISMIPIREELQKTSAGGLIVN